MSIKDEYKKELIKYFAKFAVVGFLLIVLCFLVFKVGGVYSCSTGQGVLYKGRCVNVINLGACTEKGKLYTWANPLEMPEDMKEKFENATS